MKAKFYLSLILTIIFGFNVTNAQNKEFIPFNEFAEISGLLSDEEIVLLKKDTTIWNAQVLVDGYSIEKLYDVVAVLYGDNYNFTPNLSSFPNLKFVFLSGSGKWTDIIFTGITGCKKLEYLFIEDYELKSFTNTHFKIFPKLKILNIKGSNLSFIPSVKNENIEILSITDCEIQEDGYMSLLNYPSLRVLDLSNNKLKRLPNNNYLPDNIKTMVFHGNQLGAKVKISFSNIESLDIGFNNISKLTIFDSPKLTELDISGNNFTEIPFSTIEHQQISTLRLGSDLTVGTLQSFSQLAELDALDVSFSQINNSKKDLFELRFALPHTTIVYSMNDSTKITSKKIADQIYLEQLRDGFIKMELVPSLTLAQYFINNNDLYIGDYVMQQTINNQTINDVDLAYKVAKYLDQHNMLYLADKVYQNISNNKPFDSFIFTFNVAQSMMKYHYNLAKSMLPEVKADDSLSRYLENVYFRIEYTSLLFLLGNKLDADLQFSNVYQSLDKSNDIELYRIAKYFDQNNCVNYAIKVYNELKESPEFESEERKFYAELCIADLMNESEMNNEFTFLQYDNLCFREFESDNSKKILKQSCKKALSSYQQKTEFLIENHRLNLMSAKKKTQQGGTNKQIGNILGLVGDMASNYIPVDVGGASSLLFEVVLEAGEITLNHVGDKQKTIASCLMSDAVSTEEKISKVDQRKKEIKDRIDELNN